jgi:hypothetical protein
LVRGRESEPVGGREREAAADGREREAAADAAAVQPDLSLSSLLHPFV